MKLNILFEPPSVTVITPTIASPKLMDAVVSVHNQTYSKVKHLIVVDGYDHYEDFCKINEDFPRTKERFNTLNVLTENTGANGFYGHRIYAAFSHLVNTDYVFFLDDDNWYEPDHVESLVDTLQSQSLDFAYSLRNIYDENKEFVCRDDCESLGKWPIWFTHDNPQYLIDTSSFAFKRDFLIQVASLWHSGWGGDRRFFYAVKDQSRWNTSGKYSLNYRLDGNPNSVKSDFFLEGNTKQKEIYGDTFPWAKT